VDRPALLLFYKGDCGASVVAAPVLPRFGAVPDLVLVAVSQDPPNDTAAFAAAHGWDEVTVLFDAAPWPASNAFGIDATPTWVLLAPGGRVEAVGVGWSRDDANQLAATASRLAGFAPAPVVSSPGGAEPALRPG
jgi:hypothetical protein